MNKRYFHIAAILFLLSSSVFSQVDSVTLDSLKQVLAKGDESSIAAARDLIRHYDAIDKASKEDDYCHQLMALAKKHSNLKFELIGLRLLMISKYEQDQIDSSFYYADETILNYQEDESELVCKYVGEAYYYKGMAYFYSMGDYEKAYKNFMLAFEKIEQAKDGLLYSYVAYDLANMYLDQEKENQLIKLVDDAVIKMKTLTVRPARETDILYLEFLKASAVGSLSKDTKKRLKALKVYQKLWNIHQSNNDIVGIIGTTTNMIDYFEEELTIDSCLYYAEEVYTLLKEKPNTPSTINFLTIYVNILNKKKEYQKAIEIYDLIDANAFMQQNTLENRYYLLEQKIISYRGLNRYGEALSFYDQYIVLQDSMFQQDKENELEIVETKYALDKKETENSLLQSENEIIQSRSNLLSLIGLLLLGMLGLGFYFYYKIRENNKQLQKINDSKNQLFAILAHDLKGPSRAFNNLSNKLSFLIKKNDSKRLLEVAEHFEKTGNQVNYMMDNLLNWAISQKDEFVHNPQRIDIQYQLENIIKELEYILSSKNIKIENNINKDLDCVFDPNAFKVVMRNLLHNAIKFSKEDSTIIVEADERKNLLKIIDTGIGMPPELIENIIKEKPLESRIGTAEEKGNGIGLSTCIKLIHKNESKIKFESREEKGTTVILEMKRFN